MNNLSNDSQEQFLDDQARQIELLDALWAVHHSGLEEEAVTLAYGCGLGSTWKKELA